MHQSCTWLPFAHKSLKVYGVFAHPVHLEDVISFEIRHMLSRGNGECVANANEGQTKLLQFTTFATDGRLVEIAKGFKIIVTKRM